MRVFEIGDYKYSEQYGNPALIPSKLKEDQLKGRRSKRSDVTLAVMKDLKDGKIFDIKKIWLNRDSDHIRNYKN